MIKHVNIHKEVGTVGNMMEASEIKNGTYDLPVDNK